MKWLLVALLLAAGPAQAAVDDPRLELWLDEHGPLRVGLHTNVPPTTFQLEDGSYAGWGADMLTIASLKSGVPVEIIPYETPGEGVELLRNGDVHAVGILSTRPDVSAFAQLGEPWAYPPIVLMTNQFHDWASPDDAQGRISTIEGSPLEQIIHDQFGHMEYVSYAIIDDALQALANGTIDAYVGPIAIVGYQAQQHQLSGLRPIGEALSVVEAGFWTNDPDAAYVMQVLRDRVTEEEARIIYVKWTGFDLSKQTEPGLPNWLWQAGIAITAAGMLGLIWIALLRRQVGRQTASLSHANESLRAANESLDRRVAQRTAELESANDALRTFAHTASHDLRAPLLTISGFTSLLQEDLADASDDSKEILEQIIGGARRMNTMLDGLLSLSTAANTELQHTRVDIEAAANAIAPDFPAITWNIESGPPVYADQNAMQLLLQNVMSNAAKHGATQAQIQTQAGDHETRLIISDDGPGFDAETGKRIWEPFERGTSHAPGTGIGLATVKRIVSRHGGTVECDGSNGATFTFTFPEP